ncbi:MAG: ribonuclease P protein component [Actinomycetota bacterium]|nr:ribonuclease P protein component [Actinomycetota bacterium]
MLRTIKSSGEIDALFKRGSRAANNHVVVIAAPTEPKRGPVGRVVFIAGKKSGNAVFRSRGRRVLRAAAVRLQADWSGWDVALIARPSAATIPPQVLDAALKAALTRLGVMEQ